MRHLFANLWGHFCGQTGITLQNLLYEWRYTPTAARGVMVVVKQEK
ncbi:hypothetical protein [Photorhabdus viridis]